MSTQTQTEPSVVTLTENAAKQIKEMLSTYGANEQERSADVIVTVDGKEYAITEGEVEYGTWDEEAHTWVNLDQPTVRLQAVEQ